MMTGVLFTVSGGNIDPSLSATLDKIAYGVGVLVTLAVCVCLYVVCKLIYKFLNDLFK